MKVLTFNYKTDTEYRNIAFNNSKDAIELFNDILDARNKLNSTLIINGNNKKMMISPCEILEMTIFEDGEKK